MMLLKEKTVAKNNNLRKGKTFTGSKTIIFSALAFLFMFVSIVLPNVASAWIAKDSYCMKGACHVLVDTTANQYVARDQVVIADDTGTGTIFISKDLPSAAGRSFELDWYGVNTTNGALYDAGVEMNLPDDGSTDVWTAAAGTSANPGWGAWSDEWDVADGMTVAWAKLRTQAGTPTDYSGWVIDFDWNSGADGSNWESTANRDTARDGTHSGGDDGTDLDGTGDRMGTDATVTIATVASGTYSQIQVANVGHEGSDTSFKGTEITVNIVNITSLVADKADYGEDETITIDFTGDNTSANNLTNSTIYYLIFIDENGDGVPNPGPVPSAEVYIKSDGTSGGDWTSGDITTDYTQRTTSFSVNSSNTNTDQWTISNSNFPQITGYTVYAEWVESNTAVIDTANNSFNSVTALGFILILIAVVFFVFFGIRKGILKTKKA